MLSFFTKFYKKFRTDRKQDLEKLVMRTIRMELVKHSIIEKSKQTENGLLNQSERKERIVVSLTSFGSRVGSAYVPIECMERQTMKADEVVLWLSAEHFSDKNLPETIKRLKNRGLTVKYRKDLGPHTKLFYAIKEYPDDVIITIDDDHIYPDDLVETLYNAHKEHPDDICCNVAKRIPEIDSGRMKPYHAWDRVFKKKTRGKDLMPLGVNGVLYVPGCFDTEVSNVENLKRLSPKADDVWFKMMHFKRGMECLVTGAYPQIGWHFIALESAFIDALQIDNVGNDMNVEQIIKVMDHYELKLQ